jgi:hypothetical protein
MLPPTISSGEFIAFIETNMHGNNYRTSPLGTLSSICQVLKPGFGKKSGKIFAASRDGYR